MRVSAYEISNAFGIDALAQFYSVDNAEEIQRVREEWHSLSESVVCIKSFNDGDSVSGVMFDLITFECWRTDHPDVILEPVSFIDEKVQVLKERERVEKLFGIGSNRLLNFLKFATSAT